MTVWTMILASAALALGGCAETLGDDCRGNAAGCGGGLYCCAESRCGRGMCTSGCASDRDCPGGSYCESRMCWRGCASDRDCPDHLRCKPKDGRLMCRGD